MSEYANKLNQLLDLEEERDQLVKELYELEPDLGDMEDMNAMVRALKRSRENAKEEEEE